MAQQPENNNKMVSRLHHTLISHIMRTGWAPDVTRLGVMMHLDKSDLEKCMEELQGECRIHTTIGGKNKAKIVITVKNDRVSPDNLFVHFPIPMRNAWDNVIYTCANMLVFENEQQVKDWSAQCNIGVGAIEPIAKVWQLAKLWYGNHIDPDWRKHTVQEAQDIFNACNLVHDVWKLDTTAGEGRF